MFWSLLLAALAGLLYSYFRWTRRRLHQIHSELPLGFKSYPVIGHAHLLKTSDAADSDNEVWFKSLGQRAIDCGGVTSFWLANKLYIVVADPETSEVVLKTNLEKGFATQIIRTVTGNGNIFAPVDIWRPRRKILAPVFSMKNLNQFVRTFDEQSVVMADLLRPMAGAGDFSVWTHFTTYTFDAVCETTLGIKLKSQENPDHKFLTAFDFVSQAVARRMVAPWLYPDFIYQRLPIYKEFCAHTRNIYDFVDEIIQTKKRELATIQRGEKNDDEGETKTFLDMMIESSGRLGQKYSDLELREEVTVLVMAGTDTSAVGASFAAVMLSRHPRVQDKLHHELDEVFGSAGRALAAGDLPNLKYFPFSRLDEVFGSSGRAVAAEDLPNLKYLEAVVKETLRLYPPVPVTAREITTEVKLPCGSTLVPGVSVVLDIWATHRNPAFWGPDAAHFRPERFLEGPLKHPTQFQPFSLSMRNCLGYNYAMMSMKTMLANTLRRYRLLPRAGLRGAALRAPLRVSFDVMMRDMDNYIVRLEARCNAH